MSGNLLTDRAVGCLAGAAVGDALGGATEGWESHEIQAHFGGWVTGIVESIRRTRKVEKPFSPFHKGDGHVTDDTLMTRVLVHAYDVKRDHLDAYDVEALIVPAIVDEKTWVPELDREDLLYHRLFLAEKWLVLKLRYGHADPRDAGVGNIVNCGAAMYIAPVGIANAGDPRAGLRRGARPDGRAPVELRARGGGRARRGRRRGDAARGDAGHRRRDLPAAREGRHPLGDRGGRRGGGEARRLARRRARRAAARRSRRSTRSASTTRRRRRTPGSRAGCTRSRSCRSRSGCSSRPAATTRRPSSAASTTAGTRTRSPRWAARSRAPSAIARSGATGSTTSRRRAGSTSRRRAATMAAVATRSSSATPSATRSGRARSRRWRPGRCLLEGDVGSAGGPRRPRAQAGARGGQGRRRDRGALARRGRRAGAGRGRLAGAGHAGAARARARAARRARRAAAAAGRRRAGGLRGDPRRRPTPAPARPAVDLAERIEGAWLGRAAGCVLGKPVENIPREGIRAIARGDGELAGRRLVHRRRGFPDEVSERWPWNRASRPTSLAENIDGIPEDDDLNFTMLGVALLERCGTGFDALDVAKIWLDYMPPGRIFTAERVAVRNLLEAYLPPETATRRNPFREWIGARLRVDAYGWAAPGDPVAAARMAWEDARVSHTANGVYAAMFMAAAHAASLSESLGGRVRGRRALASFPRAAGSPTALRTARELAGEREWEAVVDELYARSRLPLGARDQQHRARRRGALRLRRRLLRRDLARPSRAAGTRTRTAPRSARSSARSSAPAGIEERWSAPLEGRFASSLPGFDGITIDELVAADARRRRRACAGVTHPARAAARPARPAADRPADAGAARPGRRARRARRGEDLRRARRSRRLARLARGADALARRGRGADRATTTAPTAAPELAWTQRLLLGRARLALGRAALRPRGGPLHAGAVLRRVGARVRRLRRDRALARVSRDRDRRAEPVRLLPRRARDRRARRRAAVRAACASSSTTTRGTSGRAASRSRTTWRSRTLVARARSGRRLPRHDEGGAAGPPGGARPRAARDRARRRVDPAARARLRPPPLVGAVVRGQRRSGRAAGALVRAAPHAPPHAPLEPRPPRGAAQRLAERRRHARLGERLRRLGRLERAGQGAAAGDAARAARHAELLATGEWTPLAAASPDARRRRVALDGRRDDALGARESRRRVRGRASASWRSRSAGAGHRGVRRLGAGDGRRRRRHGLPGAGGGARARAGRPRRRGAGRLRRASSRGR